MLGGSTVEEDSVSSFLEKLLLTNPECMEALVGLGGTHTKSFF